jgi:hypothetical protein
MSADNRSLVGLQSHMAMVFADGNPRPFVRFAEGMCLKMVHYVKLSA